MATTPISQARKFRPLDRKYLRNVLNCSSNDLLQPEKKPILLWIPLKLPPRCDSSLQSRIHVIRVIQMTVWLKPHRYQEVKIDPPIMLIKTNWANRNLIFQSKRVCSQMKLYQQKKVLRIPESDMMLSIPVYMNSWCLSIDICVVDWVVSNAACYDHPKYYI